MKKQWHIDFPSDTVWFKLYLAEHEGNRGVYINKNIVIDTKQMVGVLVEVWGYLTTKETFSVWEYQIYTHLKHRRKRLVLQV